MFYFILTAIVTKFMILCMVLKHYVDPSFLELNSVAEMVALLVMLFASTFMVVIAILLSKKWLYVVKIICPLYQLIYVIVCAIAIKELMAHD